MTSPRTETGQTPRSAGNGARPDNTIIFPTKEPATSTAGYHPHLYADLVTLLRDGLPTPPAPTIGMRTDEVGLLYEGMVNLLFGDPESGKTLVCLCIAAERLFLKHPVLVIDLDHNGVEATVSRLLALGVNGAVLSDPALFRYAEPEDQESIVGLIADAVVWKPGLVIIDSVGELLPLYGANSNSPDDFTRVHTAAVKPFAKAGAAVALIDHLAKNTESRNFGSSGTAAKKRAISGTSLRVTVTEAFTPGKGGRSDISIAKDRHGGLRANSPTGDKEPLAAKFALVDRDGALDWHFYAPENGDHAAGDETAPRADIDALVSLQPAPTSVTDVKNRMAWGTERARRALKSWRDEGSLTIAVVA